MPVASGSRSPKSAHDQYRGPQDGDGEEHRREDAPHAGLVESQKSKRNPDTDPDDERDGRARQQKALDLPIDLGEDFQRDLLVR